MIIFQTLGEKNTFNIEKIPSSSVFFVRILNHQEKYG
jgi:precorrin-6x reductase